MAKSREAEVRQAVEGLSVDQVVGEISALGLHVAKALGELSSRLVAEVERLATLREAVTLEDHELQRLHNVDVVAAAVDQLVQEYEQRLVVANKDAEADRRVAELRIKTLEEMTARQVDQLAALQKQLDEAKQQVQDIAVKAIEGASGARALAHVNQIAIEQARTRPPQG